MEDIDLIATCRLCASNLMDFPECYLIDEEMENLINTLTTITFSHVDDKENLRLCINCYECLNAFNEFKHNAIATHEKLMKLDNVEVLVTAEVETDDDEEQYEEVEEIEEFTEEEMNEAGIIEYLDPDLDNDDNLMIDDGNEEEYVDNDLKAEGSEEEEVEYAVENILEGNDFTEKFSFVSKTTAVKRERVEQDKGKETYQKLLQKCHICCKMVEKNRMEGHINKHNNLRPFACSECEKTFYCKQLLRLHKSSIHTNIKVKCEQCDKFFPSARALYAHTLRHKNQDRYICNMCDKKFNNSNSLKRHMAIHSGVREFVCTICGVGFYRKFNLDVHVKNVHNQTKEFSCSYNGCKKNFGYMRLLKDHMKRHHPQMRLGAVEF